MPHVIVKMYSGKTDEQKTKLAEEITKVLVAVNGNKETSISVDIQDIEREDWVENVYKKDILPKMDKLVKKPGYNPL